MVPVLVGLAALACLVGSSALRRAARRAQGAHGRSAPGVARSSASSASSGPAAAPVEAPPLPRQVVRTNPLDRLVGSLGAHRWARRGLGVAAVLLVVAALGTLGYPLITDQVEHHLQKQLRRQFVASETRTAYVKHQVKVGDSLTRIKIPKMGLDTIVVEGTTLSALRAGAGHYTDTPLPCAKGNVGIAGHRTTYGKPFNRLAELAIGDEITLETPIGSCTYRVSTAPFPVDPSDYHVVDNTPDAELTLTTCHPEGSARQRLVVHATLVRKSKGAVS